MSTAEIHLRLQKWVDGQTIDQSSGVVANVYATDKDASSQGKYGLTIPVSDREDVYRRVELEPGSYMVESVLPSGEVVREEITLREGELRTVALRGDSSPHEWLSWQQLAGNVSSESSRIEDAASADGYSFAVDTLSQGVVELGRYLFDPDAASGKEQWDTVAALIGVGSSDGMLSLRSASEDTHYGYPPTDQMAWISAPDWDETRRVIQLRSNIGLAKTRIRDFLYWTAAGAELIRVPVEWRTVHGGDEVPTEIMIDSLPASGGFHTAVMVKDPALATSLAYLVRGFSPQSRVLMRQAKSMLFEKFMNPYSAAAGAYILLAMSKPDQDDHWPRWIRNLDRRFKWLPDGAVLKAWLTLITGDREEAKPAFKSAYARGLPLYSLGISRLLDGLSIFSEDDEFREMEQTVRRVAWRTNMEQYFTTIRLGP